MGSKRFFVILNEKSGTAMTRGLTRDFVQTRLEEAGYEAEVVSDLSKGLEALAERAIKSDAEVIVAGGGDGTVTGIAEHLVGHDKPLLILPLGTANALARDLNMELDFDRWVDGLEYLKERRIDVGSVNGKRFMHLVVIGLMPGIASAREKVRQHQTVGTAIRFMAFLARRFARTRRITVDLIPEGGQPETHRVSAIAVGNNLFDAEFGHVFTRQVLDDGQLSIYLLRRIGPLKALQLALGMVFGWWRQDEEISLRQTGQVTVTTRRKLVKVMFDGEPMSLRGPLHFRIEPKALRVLAPPPPAVADRDPA